MPHLADGYSWYLYSDANGSSWLGLKLDGKPTDFRFPLGMPSMVDEVEQNKIIMRAAASVKFSLATAILEYMEPESFDFIVQEDNVVHAENRFVRK